MSDDYLWSSSPLPDYANGSWHLGLGTGSVSPNYDDYRSSRYGVRCLRNSIVEPLQTFTLTFLSGDVQVWS